MPDAGGSERGSVTCELSCVLMDTLVSTMARKATHWQCFRPSVPATAGSAPSKAAVEAAAATWDKQHLAALGLAEVGAQAIKATCHVCEANVSCTQPSILCPIPP
jgi:hypothetical protein